jgi:hypothetical protein
MHRPPLVDEAFPVPLGMYHSILQGKAKTFYFSWLTRPESILWLANQKRYFFKLS